jgi:nicotinate-nucleotide adenylyltransferase
VQEARWQLELDIVVLMPVGEPPHKQVAQDPGREVRFELCKRLAGADESLEVSRLEIEREGPSYTVDTLRALRRGRSDDDLFLILGGDMAATLASWRDPEHVLLMATVAVAEREQARQAQVRSAIAGIEGSERVTFFAMPGIEISSTLVRERVNAGQPYRHLVPGPVADFIQEEGLYRVNAPVGTGEGA